ncbi:hypothetical protein CUJ83_01400 [Methanocella sp. CWC-04]|uniref:PAS domain S-box-containing protein n=1 Tax=Methanooceanicella nereidis TaxID=2052831 RepID=A0AAP2RAM3_9EURY|nr:PAS domain S-box protein [Methanocella sp. CWC-04]MCD1293649.1 hypothetical protein [Methanocella sp. CWC-04]
MQYKFSDLIDVHRLKELLNKLYNITGIPAGIIDNNGNVIVETEWPDICAKFHRANPLTADRCLQSDLDIISNLIQGESREHKCKNGLWDIAIPITISGERIATLFIGQFFYDDEPIDLDRFRSQATESGFNINEYIEAIHKAPVHSRKKIGEAIEYYVSLVSFICETGLSNLKHVEAEKNIRDTNERFKILLENSLECIVVVDKTGIMRDISPSFERVMGYDKNELRGESCFKFFKPDELSRNIELFKKLMETPGCDVRLETSFRHNDGTYRIFETVARNLIDVSMINGIVINAYDITNIKKTEEALKMTEETFRVITENMRDVISLRDRDGKYIYISPSVKTLLGYDPEELIGKDPHYFVHPDDMGSVPKNHVEHLFSTGKEFTITYRTRKKSGEYVWFETIMQPIMDDKGDMVGLQTSSRDISDRKKAEEEIKRSKQIMEKIISSLNEGIFIIDPENRKILDVNKKGEDIFGYSRDDLVGNNLLFLNMDHKKYEQHKKNFFGSKDLIDFETLMQRKNGEIFPAEHLIRPLYNDEGKMESAIVVIRDITERKKAEESIIESKEKFRNIFASSPIGIALYNENGELIECNDAGKKIFGITDVSQLGGLRSLYDAFTPDDCKNRIFSGHMVKYQVDVDINKLKYQNPENIPGAKNIKIEVTVKPLFIKTRSIPDYYLVLVEDITQRIMAEEKIKSSLQEKELLLKEVHHRVKNNMQVISSMLNLQANSINDPVIDEMFKDSCNRIRSMALIHEKLYMSSNLAQIDMADYLRSLTTHLIRSSGKDRIDLTINTDKIFLDIDTAIPCGLIVNELISNSLKHAFTGNTGGAIKIDFYRSGDKSMVLSIEDNGAGIPESIDFRNTITLGLQLVNSLAEQLRGTIELIKNPGTRFIIRFDVKAEK